MKKGLKQTIAVLLALVMLLGTVSVSFASFAEEQEQSIAVPAIQTLLTDGKALIEFLETDFLSLEKADALLADSLPALSEQLCTLLGDLFYQMGYSAEQYPTDEAGLMLALARVLGSLNVEVFREPEKVETTDMSLVYNLAQIGGTEYVESINAALPEALRFDLQNPVLKLSKSQMSEITEYYARWKAGDLRLDDFDIKNYLGETTPTAYLKAVLLVFIADDERLPAITKKAIDFEFTAARKAALASAVATILDSLHTAPVTAIIQALADPAFQAVLKPLLETANRVTVRTDYYSYKIFNEGIFTDTDGSAIENIVDNGDGTYSYMGPSMVSAYLDVIDALFALLNGIDVELEQSVLQTLLKNRLPQLQALATAGIAAAKATLGMEQNKLLSDIHSAQIEKRFAQKKLDEIDSGAYQSSLIAAAQAAIDTLSRRIAALQAELLALENEEALAKEDAKGYYETLAELEATITEENRETVENSAEYLAAKARVDAVEASLAANYARQKELNAEIAAKSAQADDYANEIYRLQNAFYPSDAKSVYNKMISAAEQVISDSNAALAALPAQDLSESVFATLGLFAGALIGSFEGVYDTMLNESPVKALLALLLGLRDAVDIIEAIDWSEIAAVADPFFAEIDGFINNAAGAFIGAGGGANLLAMLEETVNGLLDTYGVFNYIELDSLDSFLSTEILGDNSEVMLMAANALGEMFPGVQANYESIVSCLIPILSAFNFGEIMANTSNIAASLSYASPSAFAYLAGLSGSGLQQGYLTQINANLRSIGYSGSAVTPLLSLDSTKQSRLLRFAQMEAEGSSLAEIQAAGFAWTDYVGSVNRLEIANAFIKIALGDADKLGEVASAPGLGKALANLLCDLLADLKTAPAATILKKLSSSEDLAAIVDFAMNILNGYDTNYLSYDLYFNQTIFYDAEGNPAFYAYLNDNGDIGYKGPRAMQYYLPVIAAALDFLDGIYTDVQANGGDLLKTMLFDKTPQIKNLIASAIAYTDERGERQAGAIFYLLMGYGDYIKSENAQLCYDLLISLADLKISKENDKIEQAQALIAIWENYLEAVHANENAAMLAKAKELGIMEAEATAFSQSILDAAIEAKTAALHAEITALEQAIAQDENNLAQAEADVEAAGAALDLFLEGIDALTENDTFLEDLAAIIEGNEIEALSTLREDCEAWFNGYFGDAAFEELAVLITSHYEEFDDAGEFLDALVFATLDEDDPDADGMNLAGRFDQMDADYAAMIDEETGVVAAAQAQLNSDVRAKNKKAAELEKVASGSVRNDILAAAQGVTVHISDNDLDVEGDFSAEQIEDSIQTINNVAIVNAYANIAAQNEVKAGYQSEKEAVAAEGKSFNAALVPLAATVADSLAEGIVGVICGNAANGSENIYHYIMNHRIADIFTTGGRLEAIFDMLVGMYAPALQALVSEGLLANETAQQLIYAVPSFEGFKAGALARFPDAFKQNPVGAVGDLLGALCSEVLQGFAKLNGELTHDTLQLKKINRDITEIFDADFGADWLASYSKCVVVRIGAIYRLLADVSGLSFIQDLLEHHGDTKGVITGKIDTSKVYSDVTVFLYKGDTQIASVVVAKDSDGSFTFENIEEGSYSVKMATRSSIPVEIVSVDVLGDSTTDLTEREEDVLSNVTIPVGDTDGDGVIDAEDIGNCLLETVYGSDDAACDINCDGTVDIADLSVILAEGNYTAQQEVIYY